MSAHRKGGIPAWAISRPIGTIMLTSVLIVLGVFYLTGLPLDLLPQIVYPQLRVGVNNSGVEPEVLEETIAKPLEAALSTTEDLTRLETEIQEGRVGVNLHFEYGTDLDFALQDAAKNLERARSRLPEEADPPTIYKLDPSQIPIFEIAFSSATTDLITLRDWVDMQLRPQLLLIEGVASVDISGGLVREVQVLLDQERLRSYGLSVSEVIGALRLQNQDVAAGRVSSPTWEVVGKTSGKFRTVDDVRSVLLTVPGQGRIPLSEIAAVRDTSREQRLWARLDGVPSVKVSIRKQPNANTVAVADEVADQLALLQESGFIPPSVTSEVIQNQADFIRNSVASVRNAALIGAVLAMLVVVVFLRSVRKTIVIGLAIPIAIIATFMMMGLGDLTLNIMSLGGLALGVGLLVDNSIVMLENIFRKRDEGIADPEAAARAGAGEVQTAVIASTTTNLAAVVPFLLISGLAALIFREMILTISFAILASLAVALTMVPMLAAQLAKIGFSSGMERWRPLVAFDAFINRSRDRYRGWAESTVRRRWWVLGGALAAFALSFFLARGLGNEFLPQVDDGGVGVFIGLPPASTPEQTNAVAREIEGLVAEMPHVEHVFTTAGGFLWGGSSSERAGRGSMDIRLVPPTEREMSADEWVATLQQKIEARGFAGARIGVRPPRIRGLRTNISGSDVSISIRGEELPVLQALGEDITRRLRGIPGLENIESSTEEASPQLAIRLDRERTSYLGLDVQTVGQTVRTALDGAIATRYTEGNREYDVRVMLPRQRFSSPEDIGSVALFPGGGGSPPVYLRDIATVAQVAGPTTILRENQSRVLRLSADVLTDVAPVGVVNDSIRARLASLELPENYGLIYGGEEEAIRENNRQLLIVILLAVFLVFVVLAVQYESVINPLVIILAMPLSLIGVGLALRLTGTPMSAPVLLGVILLAGIVVNNAILLVEYTEQFREERGESMISAVIEAGAVRLRPILMTTLTTLLGMLPLALGIGEGSELMQPLAIAVVGGLTVSTFLTLFVVPSAYVIFNTGGERVRAYLLGRRTRRTYPEGASAPAGD